jgi:hypothetical protein
VFSLLGEMIFFAKRVNFSKRYYSAAAQVIYKDKLILCASVHGMRNVGFFDFDYTSSYEIKNERIKMNEEFIPILDAAAFEAYVADIIFKNPPKEGEVKKYIIDLK